uniref:Epidermal growth factor receptor pathway substrate 15 n=1 Tax=Oncorhynchus mykiss TaxID=8022 RepID=A0A8C7NIL2_ONCMY
KMYVVFYVSPQLSSGNPVYEKYYKQVDPSGSGQVAAADAALFLKRSGLADLVLGKVWDLADSERKGCLNKQQFFIALRLVACAQNGLEVALKSIHLAVSLPKFQDTSSPLLLGGVSIDSPWVVTTEEKLKFDAVFVSLSPVSGMLSGEKVKPVLLNSKLPVDVLGRVWELSDLDRDGMLDRDEFAVAMYLVYRALEGEPVPMSLPAPLVPPSKRKKPPVSVPPVMPLIPSPPSIKESRSSLSGSKTLPSKPAVTPVTWAVSPPDKSKYDEVFAKTDLDMDGMVSGPEVRDIFLKTGLPSATLAHIWELCDIGDMGKLTREQFALALHLINQKLTTGVDPPQNLSPEMIPPSDRLTWLGVPSVSTVIKYSCLLCWSSREKSNVEQEIKEQEKSIRERTSEVQDLQNQVQKESGELQRLQSQRQEVQDTLEELDQQKTTLEEQLRHICQQCSHENQLILSLEAEHTAQEQRIEEYEEQLVQAREELLRLQEESQQLEEKVQAAREHCSSTDPFGGDPFKGTDPFSADSFFKQSSASPFPSADPFSGSASLVEPDLFPAPLNDAAGLEPFSSKANNKAARDPFSAKVNNVDADPFGSKMDSLAEADPFGSQCTTGPDPFSLGFADFSALAKVKS